MGTKLPGRRKRRPVWPGAIFLSIFLVFVALSVAMLATGIKRVPGTFRQPHPGQPATPSVEEPHTPLPTPPAPAPSEPLPPATTMPLTPPSPEPVKPRHKGTLVIILDDAGHNLWQLEPFLDLPFPLSIAVLPQLPHTRTAAAMAVAAGKELLLHQPMEATSGKDPGPGAIHLAMEDHEIRLTIRQNLAQLPGVAGMNNHMGSKATADRRIMAITLDEARRAGVYFLDSFTIAESVVHSVASSMNLRTWERTVFLDNTPDRASIMKYVSEGTKIAEKRGYAIMIGHVWSAELAQTLSDLYPQLVDQGFSLSTISKIGRAHV